jgi:hypothetical protein
MRRHLAWTWKEAREHAGRLRLLVLAIPTLTLLAGWIWAEALTLAHGEELAFRFAAGALVLHGLLVAASLFTADVGEGQTSPAQRLPGGLGGAFAAKSIVWASSAVLALVVGALSTAGVLWLAGQPERAWAVVTPWSARDGVLQLAFAGEALVYSACIGVVAACMRHPGSAVAAGTVLYGLLLGPVWLAALADPRVFPLDAVQGLVLEALALAMLAAAAMAAWMLGRRRVASGWRAAALAGGVLVALYGAGAVSAASTIERHRELEASDDGWSIHYGFVGRGGRFVFARVEQRVGAWPLGAGHDSGYGEVRVIDLEQGTWTRAGRRGASLVPMVHGHVHRLPLFPLHGYERMALHQAQAPREPFTSAAEVLWFDGATGAFVHQELDGYPDAKGVAFTRAMARDLSPVRDSQGRRTWLFDGFLEREGDAAPIGIPAAAPSKHVFPVRPAPGAWTLRAAPGQVGFGGGTFAWIDADTGREIQLPQERYQPCYVLSRGRMLVQRSPVEDLRQATWQVVDMAMGASAPAAGAPEGWPRTEWPLALLESDRVLLCVKEGDVHVLHLWDPVAGTREHLAVGGLERFAGHPRIEGPNVEGWRILRCALPGERGEAWVLLSPDGRTSRVIARGMVDAGELLYLAQDGSVLAIMDQRRIVRVGPAVGQVEVLFPKVKE